MKVLITQPKGKERLVKAFELVGANLVSTFEAFSESIGLIIPTVDEELWFLSRAKNWFKDKGILVAVADEFTISTCRDKAEFYKFCKRHDFDTPLTAQVEAIIKPRFGKGSRGQIKIDRSYICQEVMDWPEYSIDYFKHENSLSIIPRLRLNVVNGESQDCKIVMDDRLISEAVRLGHELGLEYHNVMQLFYNGQEIKWLEVNPRYGGGSWMTFDKFNSPKYLVDLVNEKEKV